MAYNFNLKSVLRWNLSATLLQYESQIIIVHMGILPFCPIKKTGTMLVVPVLAFVILSPVYTPAYFLLLSGNKLPW